MRCQACRRPLRNPVSIKHMLGPDCLKRAVQAGTAPLEALEEFTAWKKSRRKPVEQVKPVCMSTLDLFDALKDAALDDLRKAVTACESVGITVTIEITT